MTDVVSDCRERAADLIQRGYVTDKTLEELRDHSKCGTSGDKNPSKRPEVRLKIQQAALRDSKNRSERMKSNRTWELKNKKDV